MMNLRDYIGESTSHDKKLMLERKETTILRFESTSTDFFLMLPNLNYGKVINGVASSSEGQNTEATTDAGGEKTGMKGPDKGGHWEVIERKEHVK